MSHYLEFLQYFESNKPGNPRKVCPELEYVVSGWRSVIAVLLKVGGGVSLISTCTYKHNIHRDNAPIIVSWPRTVAPLNRKRLDKAHPSGHLVRK